MRDPTELIYVSYCILIVLSIVLYFMLRAENKRREALGLDEEDRNRLAFQDLTDKENLWFRYVLWGFSCAAFVSLRLHTKSSFSYFRAGIGYYNIDRRGSPLSLPVVRYSRDFFPLTTPGPIWVSVPRAGLDRKSVFHPALNYYSTDYVSSFDSTYKYWREHRVAAAR